MKRIRFGLPAVLLLALLSTMVPAQEDNEPPTQEPRKIKTLLDYQSELGMSDKQVEDIKKTLQEFQENMVKLRKAWIGSELAYKKMIEEHASLDDIKKQLIQNANLRANMRFYDVVTSRKVEGLLTAEQLKKWKSLQTEMRAPKKEK